MKSILENITEGEFRILEQIFENPGQVPADFFFDDPNIDGRIEMLSEHELVSMNLDGQLFITELGRAAVVEYSILQKLEKKEQHFQLMQFWVPTAISVLALIVSIIALWQ